MACAISERPEPDQAGDGDDLALGDVEGDVGEGAGEVQVAHLQPDRAGVLGARHALQDHRAAHHRLDHVVVGQLGGRGGDHVLAVAQDGDGVGQAADLVHAVRDPHDRGAGGLEGLDHRVQPTRLGRGERAGRLVEDQQLQPGLDGAGDLDELRLGDGEFRDQPVGVEVEAELFQLGRGQLLHAAAVQQQSLARVGAGDDVLCDRQVREQVGVLEDGRDTGGARVQRVVEAHLGAVQEHRALVGLQQAGDDADEG